MYVHPKRFRKMGLGLDLSAIPDHQLREHLMTAAAAVDSFCNVPVYPQRHSFKGGSITDEQQGWTDHFRRRVYPLHTPIKALSSLKVDATNNLFVDFEAGDVYVNRAEGYVELINFAISKVGIWGSAGVPSLGLSQPVAVYSYTYGHTFSVIDEDLSAVPLESGEEDQEFMAVNGYWDSAEDVTIKMDGATLDASAYTVNHDAGFVTIPTADENSEVTASYTYRVPWEVARANALAAINFVGESKLVGKGLTGLESIEVEEVRLRRIGSRSGAEKGLELPSAAKSLLGGFVFMTIRGG